MCPTPPRRPSSLSLVPSPRTRLCSVQPRSASLEEAQAASGTAPTGLRPGAEGRDAGGDAGSGRAAGSRERGTETVLAGTALPHERGWGHGGDRRPRAQQSHTGKPGHPSWPHVTRPRLPYMPFPRSWPGLRAGAGPERGSGSRSRQLGAARGAWHAGDGGLGSNSAPPRTTGVTPATSGPPVGVRGPMRAWRPARGEGSVDDSAQPPPAIAAYG